MDSSASLNGQARGQSLPITSLCFQKQPFGAGLVASLATKSLSFESLAGAALGRRSWRWTASGGTSERTTAQPRSMNAWRSWCPFFWRHGWVPTMGAHAMRKVSCDLRVFTASSGECKEFLRVCAGPRGPWEVAVGELQHCQRWAKSAIGAVLLVSHAVGKRQTGQLWLVSATTALQRDQTTVHDEGSKFY